MPVCQKPLTEKQKQQLLSHGRLDGYRRHILAQRVFDGQEPYFTELTIGGCHQSYKHEVLRQLEERGLVTDKIVKAVISEPSLRMSMKYCNLKCALLTDVELGLEMDDTTKKLTEAAAARGLGLAPTDAALFAALQFQTDWTTDRLVIFKSKPVIHKHQRYLFALANRTVHVVVDSPGQPTHPECSYLLVREI